MKKALIFAGLAAATLSFVGCNKEADIAVKDAKPFQVVLNTSETRTAIDPDNTLMTVWAEGDQINVFHAEAGTTDYKHDTPYADNTGHPYTISDVGNGVFSGTLMGGDLEEGKSYDWYFYYPYNTYLKSPVNESDARLYIGGRSDKPQTQQGYDSRLHLAGGTSAACFPLYGIAKDVPSGTQPAAVMKPIASAIRINVVNGTSKGITIDEVEFTAPEAIVGNFFISFDKEPLAIAPYESQASATASLKVNGPTVLAAGATAAFYMGIKPFTAKANDVLSIKVKVGDTLFEKSLTLPSTVEFKSGSIKSLNVTYTGGEQIQGSTLEEIAAMENGADVQTQEVLVVGKYARGIMLGQNGTFLLAFNNAGVTGAVGDIVTVSGKVGEYAGLKQITNPEVSVVSSGNEVELPDPKVITDSFDEYASDKIEMIQYTGTLSASGSYYNVIVAGATKKGSIQYPIDTEAMAALNGKAITATGFFTGFTGSGAYLNMMSTSVEEAAVNIFNVAPQQVNVAADATSTQITVTGNVDWTAEASDGATIDPASGTGDGTITVTFPVNTDTENTKEYTVFVRTEAEGVNDEFAVEITQAKADASGVTTVSTTMEAYAKAHECTISEGQNVTNYKELKLDDVVTMSTTGEGNCGSFWFVTGTQWRLYQNKGGNVVVSLASGYKLKSVSFVYDVTNTGTLKDAAGVVVASGDVYETDASTVEFTVGNTGSATNGQVRITEVTIKYEQGQGTTPTLVDPTIDVPSTLTVVKGETSTINVTTNSNGAKTWASSDETVATVDNNGVVTGVKAGTATVTLSIAATSAYNAGIAQVAVTVTEPVVGGSTVSMTMDKYVEDHGCTVSSGNDATLYPTLQLNESVRLSTTGAPNCGSFWNTSSSNTTKQWRLYQKQGGNAIVTVANGCELVSVKLTYVTSNNGILLDAAGNKVASDAIQTVSGSSVTFTVGNTGDSDNGQVRVTAVEVVYTGNGTTFPDTPQTEITTSISMPGNKSVYIGETVELGATSNVTSATITYESENPAIATVNASGVVTGVAEGTVKVYARIAAVPGEYTAAERYCNVTVSKKPEQSDNADLFIFSELGYANAADIAKVEGTNVTLLFAKGEGTNGPKYYDSGTAVRMYSKNTLNISSAKTIKKVEFSCVADYGINDATTFSAGSCTDGVWEGSSKSIDILNGSDKQIRIVSIKVTYE